MYDWGMTRTQIQFPDPLYRRLKEIAEANDWSLADVVRRASEQYARRFPEDVSLEESWTFPTIDGGGDFLIEPAVARAELEAVARRSR